jgi:hypothetical protein
MEESQQIFVNEHIDDLRREAESLRSERRVRHRTRDGDGSGTAAHTDPRGARVRLGHWLIGIGTAVAGTAGDPRSGTAGHAA